MAQRRLARAVAAHIVAFPQDHDQHRWGVGEWGSDTVAAARSCGTACCVAGWTVRLATPEHLDAAVQWIDDSLQASVSLAAAALLDLSTDESGLLFASSASRDEVLGWLDDIGRGLSMGEVAFP